MLLLLLCHNGITEQSSNILLLSRGCGWLVLVLLGLLNSRQCRHNSGLYGSLKALRAERRSSDCRGRTQAGTEEGGQGNLLRLGLPLGLLLHLRKVRS